MDSQFFWLKVQLSVPARLTKGYCQQMARTRTVSLQAKIKLIRSRCLYPGEAERRDRAILSDAKHTAVLKDFIAPSQLACPAPQFSARNSLTISSPRALQLIVLLESCLKDNMKTPLPKLTFVYACLCKMPRQSEFAWETSGQEGAGLGVTVRMTAPPLTAGFS